MPGGHVISLILIGYFEKLIEFDLPVAEHIGIRGPSGLVFAEHVIHHALFILPAQVRGMEGDVQLAGHQLCENQVILPWAVPLQGAGLVMPVDHEYCGHIITLLFQQVCRNA